MKHILVITAVAEIATGLALVVFPSVVGHLLLGEELSGIAIPVARVAGIALVALAIACWPGPAIMGMITYSTAVASYLAYAGIVDGLIGVLLWPAVVLHLALTFFLVRSWLMQEAR